MRTRSCFVAAFLPALFLVISFARADEPAAGEEDLRARNVHFLDRAKGEPDRLILELTEETQSSEGPAPDSSTLEKLGWLNILYRNDSKAALGWFEKAIAADKKNIGALEGVVLCRMALGDNDPLAQNTCNIIEADPDSRFATLYLRVLHGSLYITDSWSAWPPGKRKAFFEGLLASGLQNPENETLIKHYLVSILLGQQKREEACKLWRSTGIVDKWLVCGFFSPEGPCGFEDVLPPELDTGRINLAKKYQVDNDQIGWSPVTLDRDTSYAPVVRAAKNAGACLFAATYVKSPSTRPAAIRLSTARSYKLWLNGVLLRVSDKASEFLPVREHVGTTLQEGFNLLMLELCGPLPDEDKGASFDFMLRLTDPEGRPIEGISFYNEFESGKPPEVRASGKELDPVALRPTAKQAYAEAVKGADRTFMDYLGYVFFLSEDDETELSFQYDSEIFAAHGDCAVANLLMAHAYRSNGFLPAQQSQNKYRSGLERAVQLDPLMTPALYHLGDIYKEKDPDKAIDCYRKALVIQPAHVDSVVALEQIFLDRGWHAERLDLLKKLLDLRPDCIQALVAMFDHYY
ncbi:MAG: hypothetical protein RDV41_15280, partial [Planctomycetota bacterium]|nr:hypothetical protein [Planctomycetota bacterium]